MAPEYCQIDNSEALSLSRNAENEVEAARCIGISVDLVAVAKRQLHFLKTVGNMPWLHHGPVVLQAIRRYEQFWMPLAAEIAETETVLPPLDVQWVWHCHCLNPNAYRQYCLSRFSKVIDKPVLVDVDSEADALHRCRKLWSEKLPSEPFDLRNKPRAGTANSSVVHPVGSQIKAGDDYDFVGAISKQSSFYQQVFQPFMWETAFLVAAKERYKCFLHLVNKYRGIFVCVPTFDIILMWTTHQTFPVAYAKDTEWLEGVFGGAAIERGPNSVSEEDLQETARLWEITFGEPYEKAGATFESIQSKPLPIPKALAGFNTPKPIYWEHQDLDVNKKHETLEPRYVIEVCILMKGIANAENKEEFKNLFVRLRALDCYKRLRSDKSLAKLCADTKWQKPWILQCELRTKGVVLDLRSHITTCLGPLGQSRRLEKLVFSWHELLQAPSLTVDKIITVRSKVLQTNPNADHPQLRIVASVTPPIQAPYLFKCVPDRVTDDTGAMVSDLVLRMKKYRPQEGRWISRTALNHAGRECFVIRMRVARGIWRRSGDRPVGVDWNERVIQICEGSWTYIAGPIGIAPGKVVGTATPIADDLEHHRMTWSLSSGEVFTIQMPIEQMQWERHLEFTLKNTPKGKSVKLLNGRKLQYQVTGAKPEEEEGFVTLIRYTAQCPQGKATALFNWKVSAVEFLPEEDAVLILLLCAATVRTVADFGGDSLGNFFIRRRMKEARPGTRDWGSVVIQNSPSLPSLTFWYLNPREVLGIPADEQPPATTSEEECHVYRSGSWLYMDASHNSKIHKAASTDVSFAAGPYGFEWNGVQGGAGTPFAGRHGVGSTMRTLSGVPIVRQRSPSVA
eukprot:Gb_32386 [translate_table: standard]